MKKGNYKIKNKRKTIGFQGKTKNAKFVSEPGICHRRDVIRTRGLRFASVGPMPRSPGPRGPSAPERVCSVR